MNKVKAIDANATREKLIAELSEVRNSNDNETLAYILENIINGVSELINAMPPIAVVQHARWVGHPNRSWRECSACGIAQPEDYHDGFIDSPWCHGCGRKMEVDDSAFENNNDDGDDWDDEEAEEELAALLWDIEMEEERERG